MNEKSKVKVLHAENCIEVNTTFAKMMTDPRSDEYKLLQELRRDYPDFRVTRRQINKNTSQEHYKGLTYEYMEWYIIKYGPQEKEKKEALLAEFELQKDIAGCHSRSKRYPVVKNWFLAKFPEISKFGVPAKEAEEENEANVVSLPAGNEEKKAG